MNLKKLEYIQKNDPATKEEVEFVENNIKGVLPKIYKEFLRHTNGMVLNLCVLYDTHSIIESYECNKFAEYAARYISIGNDNGDRELNNMTKEQIVDGLKNAAKLYEEYYMDEDLIDAINQYPEPFELVEPILEIIATNPQVDFGMPGDLVHFVEQFYKNGYEELLISSVRKNPTPHNIWMVHRCYNDIENPEHEKFAELMRTLKNDISVSSDIKNCIDEFDRE